MANVKKSVLELIGKTPLLEVANYSEKNNFGAKVVVKLEYFNPAGSVKDRVALSMIEDAEERGLIKAGATLIEPTSGNTGIGIAMVAAARGYKAILVMPETMSIERRKLLAAYGAQIVLTEGSRGMQGAIDKANELNCTIDNSFIPSQFTNQANVKAHMVSTGPEIWEDLDGNIDIFVAGIGTGGTLTGTGRFLKEKNPDIKVVAVEPADSPLLSGGVAGPHKLQGIGANFVPEILDRNIYDEIVTVEDKDAFEAARQLARTEGVLVGITSGAALFAAGELAKRPENAGKTIVALLPDTGDRYLSTELFDGE